LRYSLIYTHRAARDIQGLEGTVKDRIGKTLRRYAEDPLRYVEKLSDPRLGTYRFRIGVYRVIFDIEGKDIVILRVGHRKDIYRRL
jgi:mRNA interferase RelE/StbE